MTEELKPCPFCGAGETRWNDHNMWSGMRNILASTAIYHWCDVADEHPHLKPFLQIKGKTREEAANRWNNRTTGDR